MIFMQYPDGSCDIKFSWKERLILFRKGKLHLSDEAVRHFGNNLMRIVAELNAKLNEKTSNLETKEDSKIEGK